MKPVLEIYIDGEIVTVLPEPEWNMKRARSWAKQNHPASTIWIIPALRSSE